jgi:hypothetical protein
MKQCENALKIGLIGYKYILEMFWFLFLQNPSVLRKKINDKK